MVKSAKTESKNTGEPRKRLPAHSRSRQWGVLLVASAWMFALGVLVGRGTAPVHFDIEALQSELASLRAAVLEKEKNRFRISEEAGKNTEQLDFYENLKKSGPERTPAPKVRRAPKPAPKTPQAPAIRSNRTNTVEAKRKTEAPPQLGTKVVSAAEKPLTIQVASAKDAKSADALVDRLRAVGFPAYRERADLGAKGIWHRVRIGSFADAADASGTLEKLKARGLKPMLIQR